MLIEFIIRELSNPFEDPRLLQHNLALNSKERLAMDLLLNMIGESQQTFYPGVIVTGTVQYAGPSIIRVRLENGLDCIIHMGDCDPPGGMNEEQGI